MKKTVFWRVVGFSFLIAIVGSATGFYFYGRSAWVPVYQKVTGKRTTSEVVQRYGPSAESRLTPYFAKAGVSYPPKQIRLLAIKDEKLLELWASDEGQYKFIRSYSVKAASGMSGPKLREGDRQVPEGIYQLEYLNPNSSYYLSMKLNYPNAFDRKYAQLEGRTHPGTNIFIHGKAVSIGCLAMGDPAIEELFVLVTKVGRKNVEVAIAPSDPRKTPITRSVQQPEWVSALYTRLTDYFEPYKKG